MINNKWLPFILIVVFGLSLAACSDDGKSNSGSSSEAVVDTDDDGVEDDEDNCPNVSNSDQADANGNDIGDLCEDLDVDGVYDYEDNCPTAANTSQSDLNEDGVGDACGPYAFLDTSGESSISYRASTLQQLFISDLIALISTYSRGESSEQAVMDELMRYYRNTDSDEQAIGSALDTESILFQLEGNGVLLTNDIDSADLSYGSIATGINLQASLSGNIVGWDLGLSSESISHTKEELLLYFFNQLAMEVSKDSDSTVDTLVQDAEVVDTAYINAMGHDYSKLIETYLLGVVPFSEAMGQHLQSLYSESSSAENLSLVATTNYTLGQHSFDRAFGYFGSARNGSLYSIAETLGATSVSAAARSNYLFGYNDANSDGDIDLRSEVMMGHVQLCAARDQASSINGIFASRFRDTLISTFVAGRGLLQTAGDSGEFSEADQALLDDYIEIIALTWERCLAATTIHHMNQLSIEIKRYSQGKFVDAEHYKSVASHWSSMKGMAFSLQYSPFSPFNTGVTGVNEQDLLLVLNKMDDAPIFPEGTLLGDLYQEVGLGESPDTNIAGYLYSLEQARVILQKAYGLAPVNVVSW